PCEEAVVESGVVDKSQPGRQLAAQRIGFERSDVRANQRVHELTGTATFDESQRLLGVVMVLNLEAHHVIEERQGLVEERHLKGGVPKGQALVFQRLDACQ